MRGLAALVASPAPPTLTTQSVATARASHRRLARSGSVILVCCQPHPPRLRSLNPASIQVRRLYHATSAWRGDRSVRISQGSRCPTPQDTKSVQRSGAVAKRSTRPLQVLPTLGARPRGGRKRLCPTRRYCPPWLMRRNGCQSTATIASYSQEAYNPRSASTSTHQSAGTLPRNCWNRRAQGGRQAPFSVAPTTVQATGRAQPR